MGELFLSLKAREQGEILQTAATRSGRQAAILEKDIWVCWALQTLFSIPDHHPMAFKGGTSLSKVYRVINRFSEDVDITLDCQAFNDGFDPFASGVSKTQIRKFSDRLKLYVKNYTRDVIMPAFAVASETLATCDRHNIWTDDNGEKIWFSYPSAVEDQNDYLASEVLLEFGGRNVIAPNEQHEIGPDIAPLTSKIDYPTAAVTVLSPLRTFWEKTTLIHVECNRGRLSDNPERLSRHWFDLMCLSRHDIGRSALSDRSLLKDVIRHKKLFFDAPYANYDHCLTGRLRLIPNTDNLPGLQSDYRKMRAAGVLSSDDAPDFETLIERIRNIENDNPRIHGIAHKIPHTNPRNDDASPLSLKIRSCKIRFRQSIGRINTLFPKIKKYQPAHNPRTSFENTPNRANSPTSASSEHGIPCDLIFL